MFRRHPLSLLPLMLAGVLPCAAPVLGATWHIRPDGTGDVPTIQDAVDLAAPGDVLELAAGTYRGDGNRDVDLLGKEVLIRSAGDDPLSCVIDVEGTETDNHRAFILRNGEAPAMRSLTMKGGYMAGDLNLTSRGGGVHCPAAGPGYFENVRFEGNTAGSGGAVFVGGAQIRFEGCEFIDNRVIDLPDAGPGYGGAAFLQSAVTTFIDCRFIGNESPRFGGALTEVYREVTLIDCDFEGNTSLGVGSGIYGGAVFSNGFASIVDCRFRENGILGYGGGGAVYVHDGEISGCVFERNFAPGGGGAVCLNTVTPTQVSISACEFTENSGRWGGAVYAIGGVQLAIESCRFERNESTGGISQFGRGGAVLIGQEAIGEILGSTFFENSCPGQAGQGGAVHAWADLGILMESCTLVGNAAWSGAGVYFQNAGSVVRRTVVAFSPSGAAFDGMPDSNPLISCTDIFGNAGGDGLFGVDGGGNLSADPLFCDAANGDLTIQEASPCAPDFSGGCGLIGAEPVACGSVKVDERTWGSLKELYR